MEIIGKVAWIDTADIPAGVGTESGKPYNAFTSFEVIFYGESPGKTFTISVGDRYGRELYQLEKTYRVWVTVLSNKATGVGRVITTAKPVEVLA